MTFYSEEAGKLFDIYEKFTEKVQSLSKKVNGKKRSSKFAGSFAHWIGGSHIKTEREVICEQFLEDVQALLAVLQEKIESCDAEETTKICDEVAQIIMQPRDASSDSTTDLMKRAMIGQIEPFLEYVSTEKLTQLKTEMENAYGLRQMLPVEKNIYKTVKRMIG
jgi:hypothetical protein